VEERSRLLLRIAEGIEGEAEALARAESIRLKSLFPSDPEFADPELNYQREIPESQDERVG
jgi:hypothetical protein